MSWSVARKALIYDSPSVGHRNGTEAESAGFMSSLEGADPELCITLMERGLNFTGLKHRILSADQQWIEQFLAIGGIAAIFSALDALGQRGYSSIADALRQLECVACVKAIMNNRFGLEFIIAFPGEGFVKKLAQVLDTNNGLVKTQILELLSVLCVYSPDGYKLALEALHDYKRTKGLRYSFSLLVNELRASETEEYTCCVLAFINCALTGAPNTSSRMKLRNELIALEFLEILSQWRHTEDDNLATQIEVFHESHSHDNEQISMPGGVDINSHEDLFNALLAKVLNTPNSLPLLHLLQNLLLLDRDSSTASAAWDGIEQFVQRAVLMESPETSLEKFQEKSLNKLRTKLQEELNRKSVQSNPSSVHAPPFPGVPGVPAAPPLPSLPGVPAAPPLPGVPGVPVAPPLPGVPGVPVAPPLPSVPGVPAAPPLPSVPGVPVAPPLPGVPGVPVAPPLPGVPAAPPLPGVPGVPVAPPLPSVPGVPAAPPLPGVPGVPVAPPLPPGVASIPPPPSLTGMARPPAPPFSAGIPNPPAFPGTVPLPPGCMQPLQSVPLTPFERARQHKPKSKMRKLNWVKVSKNAASSPTTLWHQTVSGAKALKVEVDSHGVENLFAQAVVKKKEINSSEEKEQKKSKVVSLLDQKASLNVNIFLKQFKSENQVIVDMVVNNDVSKICLDQLRALEKLLPDSGQAEMIKTFSGDVKMLGTAEDFFRRLLQVKQYPLRIEAMQLRLEFQEKIEELKPSISTLDSAITELRECSSLTELFHVVLVTGNIINGGGRAGDAYGFTVSSLRRLKDTKSNIPRLSLIHYIAQLCEDQAPDILKIQEQLPSIEKASKFSHEYLESQVNELKSKVKKIKEKSKKAPDDLKAQLKGFLTESEQSLSELREKLDNVSKQIKSTAEYFCVDCSKFKVEELLADLLSFIREVENAVKENHQRIVLEEKRKKREEQKRAAEEARKKKQLEAGGSGTAPPPPEDDGCIIDNLLKEIRAGTTLRPTNRQSIKQRRKSQLNADDLAKLNVIVEQAAARSSVSDTPKIEITEEPSTEPVFSPIQKENAIELPSPTNTHHESTDHDNNITPNSSHNTTETSGPTCSDLNSGALPSASIGMVKTENCSPGSVGVSVDAAPVQLAELANSNANFQPVTKVEDSQSENSMMKQSAEDKNLRAASGPDQCETTTSKDQAVTVSEDNLADIKCADQAADNCMDQAAANSMNQASANSMDQAAANSMDQASANSMEQRAANTMDQAADNSMDPAAANSMDQAAANSMEQSAANTLDQAADNSIDQAAANSMDQASANSMDKAAANSVDLAGIEDVSAHPENESLSHDHLSDPHAKSRVDSEVHVNGYDKEQTETKEVVMGVVDKIHKGSRMTTGLAVLSTVALSLVPEGSQLIHDKFN